jgi:hypothetical protein
MKLQGDTVHTVVPYNWITYIFNKTKFSNGNNVYEVCNNDEKKKGPEM